MISKIVKTSLSVTIEVGVFFFIKGRGNEEVVEEETAAEIPFEKRPFVSLTPSDDGHWLYLLIEGIKVDATSLDYELLYSLPDGRTQGVPGTVKLDGIDSVERELLLGSESSGNFRYDEGVEQGTLTLRFRSDKGKLVGKLTTDFSMQSGIDEVASVDGVLLYTFSEEQDDYFVTMETFGVPDSFEGTLQKGPYGVFSSAESELEGIVKLEGDIIQAWLDSSWESLSDGESSDIGVFIVTVSSE